MWRKRFPGFIYIKKGPICQSLTEQLRSCMLILYHLDLVNPDGRGKVFIWRNVDASWRVTLPTPDGVSARRVTLPEQTFYVWKRFATFCKKMVWKIGTPRVAVVGSWSFYPRQLFSIQTGPSQVKISRQTFERHRLCHFVFADFHLGLAPPHPSPPPPPPTHPPKVGRALDRI